MNTRIPKKIIEENRATSAAHQRKGMALEDNRPATVMQQKKNNTGLPDNLKSGMENLSGHSLDDVKVHYNSAKPAQLNAHAFAQGTNIHLASGQEKHLPHEAWHVVQQKQGRVQPTTSVNGAKVNDSASLEKEADVMGSRALQMKVSLSKHTTSTNFAIQRKRNVATAYGNPIQMVDGDDRPAPRPVSNRMAGNMRTSLARVYGGRPHHYHINQDTGATFPDGAPHHTTGHHGVHVTDTRSGRVYSADFHRDGAYYTRSHEI